MTTIDFHTGFEGEPEITIRKSTSGGEDMAVIHAWIGYFDAVMQQIPADKDGWKGATLHYHLETGWYDEPWECDDLPLLLRQLNTIDSTNLQGDAVLFLERFREMCFDSLLNQCTITIEYD